MLSKLLRTLLDDPTTWDVPGENVTNPGDKENHNPMNDLNVALHAWGGRIPRLDFGEKDYESFADVCPSEGPAGGLFNKEADTHGSFPRGKFDGFVCQGYNGWRAAVKAVRVRVAQNGVSRQYRITLLGRSLQSTLG